MKKLCAVMLIVFIVVSMSQSVLGSERLWDTKVSEDVNYAYRLATLFLSDFKSDVKLRNPVLLENLKGTFEAVLFEIDGGGYIIVNINDLSVPEVSFEKENPYLGYSEPVYNGPYSYYFKEKNSYYSINDNVLVNVSDFKSIYAKKELDNKEEYIKNLIKSRRSKATPLAIEKYLEDPLVTWRNPEAACGPVAAAIAVKYYYDNVDRRYISPGYNSEAALVGAFRELISNNLTNVEMVTNGLTKYLNDRVDNGVYGITGFAFLEYKNRINALSPVLLAVDLAPNFGHWFIAYGYVISRGNGTYIVANDGNGSNNAWLLIEDTNFKGMVCFRRGKYGY